jgi:hypothetical protein
MESKTIFKEKDIVYVTSLGWGMVIDAGCSTPDGWVGIETNSGRIIHVDTYFVSFTEYTLEGFSQERPEELPKKGQIVWGRDYEFQSWHIYHFSHKTEDGIYHLSSDNKRNMFRLKQITTENPYANN